MNMDYDIFISFKHLNEVGEKTEDFEIASQLYEVLKSYGYNVFFSQSSLAEIGSSRYKLDIDKALDSAKVMIVVLTKAEYAFSHWVQYEWDSYYGDYLSGVRSDMHLFTLLSGVNTINLPRTLRNVHSFEYSEGLDIIYEYIKNILPQKSLSQKSVVDLGQEELETIDSNFSVLTGREITSFDIEQALELDKLVILF